VLEFIEHVNEIPEAPAEPVELPDDQRVAGLQGRQTARQGGALRRGAGDPFILEDRPGGAARALEGVICRAGFWSSVETRA